MGVVYSILNRGKKPQVLVHASSILVPLGFLSHSQLGVFPSKSGLNPHENRGHPHTNKQGVYKSGVNR